MHDPVMQAADFRVRLKALDLTIGGFASLTGANITTASYWGRERPGAGFQEFPSWVALLLTALERSPDLIPRP